MAERETDTQTEAPPRTLWQKTKRAVSEFFKGAIAAAPTTLLYTGVAFGGSALMNSAFGWDPLRVTGNTASELVGRLALSGAIGMGISGVVNSVKCCCYDTPSETTPASDTQRARAPQRSTGTELSSNVERPYTPTIPRPREMRL